MAAPAKPAAPPLRIAHHPAGRLALGPALPGHGESHAYYQLVDRHRLRHGALAGDPGAGVRNLLSVVAVAARAAMPTVTVYLGGCAERSDPALAENASAAAVAGHTAAGVASAALTGLERAIAARTALLHCLQARRHTAAGLPTVLVLIQDAQYLFTHEPHRWAAVTTQAAAVGIGILATVADTTAPQFGGNAALRARLLGQVVALRTSCTATVDTVDAIATGQLGERVSLRTAPDGVGTTCAVGEQSVTFVSYRTAPATGDEMRLSRRRWLRTYPDTELDAPTHAAFAELVARDRVR